MHWCTVSGLGTYIAVACRRAIDRLFPMCTPNISRAFWSSAVKCPVCLFSAWPQHTVILALCIGICLQSCYKRKQHTSTTAIRLPLVSVTGQQSTFLVLNPVSLSTSAWKSGQEYASLTLRVSPVCATCPAMPLPKGTRMIGRYGVGCVLRVSIP